MPARIEETGYYCPSGLDLECGTCHVKANFPNPKHFSLMKLVLDAEAKGWHIPFGGRVLCPQCHLKTAMTVGRKTLNVEVVRHTHEATARGTVEPVAAKENDGTG